MILSIKKMLKDKQLYIFILIILLFFGTFFKTHFSVDTYQLFGSENMNYMNIYLEDGRLIHFFILNIFNFLKLDINTIHIIFFLCSTIFMTLSIYFLNNILKKYINKPFICGLISILIIINPFSIELWLFTEMAIMELSIFLCIIAFKNFDCFLETKNKKNIIYSLICMLIALFSYQGTISIFIALSSLSIIKYSNNIKNFIFNNLILGFCYSLPTLCNFFVAKMMGTSRLNFVNNYIETLKFITKPALEVLFNSFWILPAGIFGAYIITSLIISITSIVLNTNKNIKKSKVLLGLIYVILMLYIFTVLPIFAQDIKSVSLFPRSTYAFGSIIGIIFAYLFINCDNNKYIKNIVIVVSITLLIIQFIAFNNLTINRYVNNYLDKYITYEIDKKIDDYQKNTGNIVKNVAFYNQQNSQKFYPELDDKLNISSRTEKMSGLYLLRYYTKKRLNLVEENNSIYNTYFKDKNWTLFSLDQIVLQDDTLHIYVY